MSELISVIVPVYNAEKYIYKCVESICQQSYSNYELILINDGSKDKSLLICKEFSELDSRIVVIDRPNGGASAARNTGLDAAKGDYIVFVDSDDYVSPDYLRNLYLAAKCRNFDIIQCNLQRVKNMDMNNKEVLFRDQDVVEITKEQALNQRKYKVSVCGKIYRKAIFDSFHFQESIIFEDDASYYIFIDRANKIGLLDETLYFYYLSDDSVMRNDKIDKSIAFIDIYKSRIEYFCERDNQVFIDGTYDRFCLVLMLTYSSSLVKGNNINDRFEFLRLFKEYYPLVIKSPYVGMKDKLMFTCYYICPPIVGRIIGILRG